MIDAEHHERRAVRRALSILAGARAGCELVRADRVLRPEVARAQPVDAREQPRHLVGRDCRQPGIALQRLVERGANIAPHRVIAGHRLVGPLQDDDVLLACQRFHDRRFREGTEDIQMD